MKKRVTSLILAVVIFVSIASVGVQPVHAASSFVTSDDGVGYIKSEEGFSEKPYWDYAQWTVGYGTRCPSDKLEYYQEHGITKKEAEELLRKHLRGVEEDINKDLIDKFKLTLTQNQFDALVSFSYNCGTGWMYENSNLRRVIVEGADENEIINRFAQWCNAGGQVLTPLLRRRLCEANMYLYGVYSKTAPNYLGYVMYDAAGGTSPFVVQGYNTEIKSAIIPTPTYEGYTFQGWYTQLIGGTKVTELDLSVRNTRLYAHWLDAKGKDPALDNMIDPVEVTVENDGVNLRPSPTTSSEAFGKANKGDTFVITAVVVAEGYTWGQYDGGWICLDYTNYESVKPKDEETPEQTPETSGKVMGTVKVSDSLRVRSGASTNDPVVDYLYNGDRVEILEQKVVGTMTWGRISKGWISMDYVVLDKVVSEPNPETKPESKPEEKPEEKPEVKPEPEPEPKPLPKYCTGTVKVSGTLNIRTGAGTNYATNGSLKNKAKVNITETKTVKGTVWGKIGEKKWISLEYVTVKHNYTNDCDTSCDVCKAERTVSHSYKSVTTKATLTRHGKVEKTCTVCGNTTSSTIKYPKTIKLSATSYTYNGKVKTPTVTVKDSTGKTLKKDTDYTVSYASGRKNVGTYKVTIKFKGKYSGTKTLTFKINPKASSIKNLTAKAKGLYVRINGQTTQSTGYEIQYSTSKTFKSVKTVTTGYKTVKKAVNSLKAKTTYYVRLRTYKTVSGVKYYSSWSAVKNIKTK